jgi:hypothetical protein
MSDKVSKDWSASAVSKICSRECFIKVYIGNWCKIVIVYTSQSVTLLWAGQVQTSNFIVPIRKIQRKWNVDITQGAVFTILHFLLNLWMGQIS